MDAKTFGEVMVFLQGAYSRTFSEATHQAAWEMLQNYPHGIVKQAAVQMVADGEEFPSPTRWFQRVKAIQSEQRQSEQTELAVRRLEPDRQLVHVTEAVEVVRPEVVARDAPRYPGMGTRDILAVCALEKSGMAHEAALAAVRAKR